MSTHETCEAILDTFIDAQLTTDTLAAIAEVRVMKKDPAKKTYGSFTELLADLDNEDESGK